jgi:hypothetical protein
MCLGLHTLGDAKPVKPHRLEKSARQNTAKFGSMAGDTLNGHDPA